MKYKLICGISCLVILLSSVFIPQIFKQEGNNRYHQHLNAAKKEACSHDAEIFCCHLPIVLINTEGKDIPGKAILNENGLVTGYTKAEDGADEIAANIYIIDNETQNNHLDSEASIVSKMRIHIRGNSSRTFDKSSYAVRLITEEGENNPQPIMGMAAHHEWALHGPQLDKTLIRNYMWYNIAGEIMDYAPNVRFCEVFLNGEYNGVYVMTEIITAGEEGARLNMSVDKKNHTFSGYLIRLDRGATAEIKNIETFSSYSYRSKQLLNIEYPGTKNLTPQIAEKIRQDFSAFEKSLYSFDFDSEEYGYRKYCDVDSFVDYFLINELTLNYDAGWLSTYIYKDIDKKYKMCIWDFNSACNNYQQSYIDPQGFDLHLSVWYRMIMKDSYFTDRLIERYYDLRKNYFSDEYLTNYIDDCVKYLGPAIDRNYEKWGYTFASGFDMLIPSERNPRSYSEAIEDMKNNIVVRTRWLDDNIETLKQYSKNSKIKKFDEDAN